MRSFLLGAYIAAIAISGLARQSPIRSVNTGPPVRVFVMGANHWRESDRWPLAGLRTDTLYLARQRGSEAAGQRGSEAARQRGSWEDPRHQIAAKRRSSGRIRRIR
jgi:predicted acyl esterase